MLEDELFLFVDSNEDETGDVVGGGGCFVDAGGEGGVGLGGDGRHGG